MTFAARTLAGALIGLLPVVFGSGSARADDLDRLFELLRTAPDMFSAQIVEQRIWQAWLHSGDAVADGLMRRGIEAMDRGDLDQAVAEFSRLIERRPDYAEGWNKRATAYYLMRELGRSVADIERTLALEPRHFGALSGMGLIFLAREDFQGALDAFRQVLRIHPRSVPAHRHVEEIRGRTAAARGMMGTKPWCRAACLVALAGLLGGQVEVAAVDRHAGYYYPDPGSSEVYEARAATLPDASRKRRILFVTELTNQMMNNPYPPPFAVFAKGAQAEKMIITSLYADGYDTLYRMRGLLALLSARARSTPIFTEYQVEDLFTFLDLLKLLGFQQITVTDGDRFAHQITVR